MPIARSLFDTAKDYAAWATSEHNRIPLGYKIIDDRTQGGVALGEVCLFQCRSQVGKTTFGLNVLNNNSDIPSMMFSLEMSGRYLVPRLAAMHTDTPTDQIYTEIKEQGGSPAVEKTVQDFKLLYVADTPSMKFTDMTAALNEAEAELKAKVRLVVIDFMELIGGIASLSDVSKVDGLARKAKDWARANDVVLLLLHQVSRGAGGSGAEALDITSGRYGGEVSADYVLGAYRPCLRSGISQEEYLSCVSDLRVQFLKTRGGHEIHPEGVQHYLNPRTMKITEHIPMPSLFPGYRPAAPVIEADAEELGWDDYDNIEPWSA